MHALVCSTDHLQASSIASKAGEWMSEPDCDVQLRFAGHRHVRRRTESGQMVEVNFIQHMRAQAGRQHEGKTH